MNHTVRTHYTVLVPRDQIYECKPSVLGHCVPQPLGHWNRPSHERNGVEECNPAMEIVCASCFQHNLAFQIVWIFLWRYLDSNISSIVLFHLTLWSWTWCDRGLSEVSPGACHHLLPELLEVYKLAKFDTKILLINLNSFCNTYPVAVVPRLAPSVRGYALLSSSSPAPARGVSVEVNTEEDWMTKVTAVPTAIACYGLNYRPKTFLKNMTIHSWFLSKVSI